MSSMRRRSERIRLARVTAESNWSPLRDEHTPVLLALMNTMGLVAMDSTILATVVPSIVADLHDYDQFPWLFSIYLLTQAVTVPVYGKIADMYGRKPLLLFGVGAFLLGSLMGGAAWNMGFLILARAVQGVGAGAISAMSMTVVGDLYTLEQRGRVQGYMASVWAISAVLGPTLGGVFAQFGSWRWIFLLNVPLALLSFVLLVRGYHEHLERHRHRLDYLGATVLTLGLTALILGVLEGGGLWPWLSWQSAAIFALGFGCLAALVPIERRAAEPVIDFDLLRRRLVITTTLVGFFIGAMTMGLTSFIPAYLQASRGLAPILAGLAVATMTLGWPLASTYSSRLYLSRGFRTCVSLGTVIALVGSAVLTATAPWPDALVVGAACFVVGVGLGLAAAPSLIAAQNSVGWAERGQVTALNGLARTAGSAIGVAVFGALSNAVIAAHGGAQSAPAIVAATQAVFVGVVVTALALALMARLMPAEPAPSPAGP